MRFNASVVPDEMRRIGAALGDAGDPAGAVARLAARAGLPARISEVGVDESELDVVARLSQSSVAVRANPRPVSEDDARAILAAAW
jgi:alcohol dehydrogenase class IV